MTDAKRRRSGRLRLALLALLFLAPPLAAFLVYVVVPEWIPQERVNHGTLVTPARPLPQLDLVDAAGAPVPDAALRGKWSLILLGGPACAATCRERLWVTRQVRLALDKKRQRVQRVYLAPEAVMLAGLELDAAHRDLLVLADAGEPGARAAEFFGAPAPDTLVLTDPNGNWLMVYAGDLDPKGLLKDLKRLLRFSRIG